MRPMALLKRGLSPLPLPPPLLLPAASPDDRLSVLARLKALLRALTVPAALLPLLPAAWCSSASGSSGSRHSGHFVTIA